MKSKEKGDVALGQAIAYYTKNKVEVLLPLGDKKPYDFVIDKDDHLFKVQVKYTSCKNEYGNFVSQLRVQGGNQSYHTSYSYKEGDFDIYVVYTAEGYLYEIPYDKIKNNKASVTLGEKYKSYKIR